MDFRRLLLIIRQRKALFFFTLLLTLAIVVLMPQTNRADVYQSSARILLTSASQGTPGAGNNPSLDPSAWLSSEPTLRELITSERLLSRVQAVTKDSTNWMELRENIVMEPLANDYGGRLSLFALGVKSSSPERAQKLTEALVSEFVTYTEDLSGREFSNTRRFLEELVAEAREKVEATEEKLLALTTEHAGKNESDSLASTQSDLETERRKLKEEVAQLETEVDAVNHYLNGQSDAPPWTIIQQEDTALKTLENSVSEARLKLLELEQLYTEQNQLVRDQRAKLGKVQSVYENRLGSYVRALRNEKAQALTDRRNRLTSAETRLEELRRRQLSASERRQVAKLERQLAMWEENHLSLVKQLYQARVIEQSSRRQGAITVLQKPFPGTLVASQQKRDLKQALLFGLPLSLALALTLVVSLEYFQVSLRILPRVESQLGLPVLAIIPEVPPEVAEIWELYKRKETTPKTEPPDDLQTTSASAAQSE